WGGGREGGDGGRDVGGSRVSVRRALANHCRIVALGGRRPTRQKVTSRCRHPHTVPGRLCKRLPEMRGTPQQRRSPPACRSCRAGFCCESCPLLDPKARRSCR